MDKPQIKVRAQKILLAVFFLSLPLTSFPYLPGFLGGTATVKPLAIYPLILLTVFFTIPALWRKPLPRAALPLLMFVLVALVSSVFALTRGVPELRGATPLDRVIRNLLTLGTGCAMYLSIALLPEDRKDLRFMLKWLYIGYGIALVWGALQAVYVIRPSNPYYELLNDIQKLLFSSRKLFKKRVSGLTFEPNWFAEQIGFILLPFLFSAVTTRFSASRWRFKWLKMEHLYLLLAIFNLLFTFSRAGLAMMFVVLVLSIFLYRSGIKKPESHSNSAGRSLGKTLTGRLALALVTVATLTVVIVAVGANNNYFSRLWRFWTDETATGDYWTYVAFGQRIIYVDVGVEIYNDYPLTGVGLGNYAFYFEENLADIPLYRYPEILRLITPEEGRAELITPKNLFIRILAETGLIGFGTFLAFLFVIFGTAVSLWLSGGEESRFWGKAGVFAAAAFFFIAFSSDSFATPNMWVVFGMITAAGRVLNLEERVPESLEKVI